MSEEPALDVLAVFTGRLRETLESQGFAPEDIERVLERADQTTIIGPLEGPQND